MITQQKNLRVAEMLPQLLNLLEDGLGNVDKIEFCTSKQPFCKYTEPIMLRIWNLKTVFNQALYTTKLLCDTVRAKSPLMNEAILCGEEELDGAYEVTKISKNTSPRTKAKAGSLVARVGHKECLARLKQVRVKDRGNRIVYTGAACQCFGFTGTGHNFLSVWSALREYGTNLPLKTYGILRFDQMNKGYKWDELFDFANAYYLNYHRRLCMHLFGHHGLYVKREQGDWFLASDLEQKA